MHHRSVKICSQPYGVASPTLQHNDKDWLGQMQMPLSFRSTTTTPLYVWASLEYYFRDNLYILYTGAPFEMRV
ncbi:hypothetical protein ACHAW5_007425 [Stephanodiscus triporus]|uniref:Uncharacterized protein n=1 Tax=Stephanodiscus triporus TaxID=2934178 RepID=A0ABD3R187_9STRA